MKLKLEGGESGAVPPESPARVAVGETTIRALLESMEQELAELIREGLRREMFKPTDRVVRLWKIDNPVVEDGIVSFSSMHGEIATESSWEDLAFAVSRLGERLQSYHEATSKIPAQVGWRNVAEWYLLHAPRALLPDPALPNLRSSKLIESAVAYCRGDPMIWRSTLRLSGFRVKGGPIEFRTPTSQVLLRSPQVTDLEYAEPAVGFATGSLRRPNAHEIHALGQIDIESDSMNATHVESERLTSLLRLFRVCGARWLTSEYEIIAPLEDHFSTGTSSDRETSLETCDFSSTERSGLERFANELWLRIPPGQDITGFPPRDAEPTPIGTAYRRYCDALTLDGGVIERRFASAVMGLESLYLTDKPQGELRFRLRTYLGRLLDSLGYDGDEIAKQTGIAYEIRSAYVHGGHLGQKLRRQSEEFGGPSALLNRIEDYLRVSIVLALILGTEKSAMQDALDGACASEGGSKRLKETLGPVTSRIPRG